MAVAVATPEGGATQWTRSAAAIVALCFGINMADGLDVTILSFIAPRLQADWAIGPDVMGNLFGAGLVGMAIGGMFLAPLADRFGRRRLILIALALMTLGMAASGVARSVVELLATRVVVGAGIGTVLAAMAALAAESAPQRHRHFAVGMVQAGYPFAAVFTGLIVAWLLPVFGWQAMLLGASLVTAGLFPLAWAILPARTTADGDKPVTGNRVGALFAPALRRRTLALWGAVFFGLMVLYFIVSWITKLSIAAGLSETNAIYAGAVYNFGAFSGTVAMSLLAVRAPLGRIVPVLLCCAAVVMMAFGMLSLPLLATLGLAFLLGFTLQGGYNGVWPIAAAAYPDSVRATGIGWAIGFGRAGAIMGPIMGGYLMAAQAPLPLLFASYCLPLLLCALCAFAVERTKV